MINTAMPKLLARVSQAGIAGAFARRALPEWWDDSIAESASGLQQACLYMAQAFNLDPKSIFYPDRPVEFRNAQWKFKLSGQMKEGDVAPGANYASAMARLAIASYGEKFVPVAPDPIALRNSIVAKRGIVNLQSLLEWCANSGIPVLHIATVPGRKMLAVAVRHNGRFSIVLSRIGQASEMLFWLAHEIGHIALGHLTADGFVIDEKESAPKDNDEREADVFAVSLLNGHPDANYNFPFHSADQLAAAATEFGRKYAIDPGHIALNIARNKGGGKAFGWAKNALKFMPEQDGARASVNNAFFGRASCDVLSKDQALLLRQALTTE